MPRATIIHNPTAGDGRVSADRVLDLVGGQGYDAAYTTTDDDLDAALQDPGDLVVAAGGDGTVGRVASRLAGRGIPVAILPLGTANNVATGLGVEGSIEELVAGWPTCGRRELDVGFARGPWGVRHFVESFGLGVFAHAMPILSALKKGEHGSGDPAAALEYDRQGLRALARDYRPRPVSLVLDGEDAAGEYVLVEALNGPMLGPNLRLAPDADFGDRRLDVVLVRAEARDAFAAWIRGNGARPASRGGDVEEGGGAEARESTGTGVPGWERRRVATLRFHWQGEPLHIDGRPWGDTSAGFQKMRTVDRPANAVVEVGLEPEGVPILAGRP